MKRYSLIHFQIIIKFYLKIYLIGNIIRSFELKISCMLSLKLCFHGNETIKSRPKIVIILLHMNT